MANNLRGRVATRANGTTDVQAPGEPAGMEQGLMALESKFAQAMPRGMEAKQLVRDAINAVRATPKLAECFPPSVVGALMTCAQLGLRPGIGALGQAHLVPFYNGRERRMEAQFIIGYQGMLELANRSNEIEMVVARMVHQNDEFSIDYGEDKLIHRPAMDGRGAVIGYYAKFYRKGSNRPTYEWMSVQDARDHRDKFASAKKKDGTIFGPWVDHFDAMALKTVVRRLFKWMPKSTEIANALIADETMRIEYENPNPSADLASVARHVTASEDYNDEPVEGNVVGSRGLPNVDQDGVVIPDGPSEEDMAAIRAEEDRLAAEYENN